MKVVSFDIGIKNMAYCFLSVSGEQFEILDWNILNLMDEVVQENRVCDFAIPNKSSKKIPENTVVKTCGKKAKYSCPSGNRFLCETHAKKTEEYWIQTKEKTPTSIKKLKLDDLITFGKKLGLSEFPSLKKDILDLVLEKIESKCLKPLIKPKSKTASETDLITVGRNMTKKLEELDHQGITHVIIENQISTIATRMKTIQGMLTQYYIMKGVENIEFISSFNKLKAFSKASSDSSKASGDSAKASSDSSKASGDSDKASSDSSKNAEKSDKDKYKERKADGIAICTKFLDENPLLTPWKKEFEESKKKDDLADCFLQGLFFIRKKAIC
jgi:hypothetical protein